MALAIAFAAVGGLLVGSFLNVVAYRLPRGESLVHPRSRCPRCDDAAARHRQHPRRLVAAAARPLPRLRRADLRPLPARRGDDRRALRRGRAQPGRRGRASSSGCCWSPLLVPIALIDLDHRIIPNKHHRPGGDRRARRHRRARHRLPRRGPDLGRRRRGVLPHRGPGLPARDGDGRRQARRRARAVPRPRGRARDPHRADLRRARRRRRHRAQGGRGGAQDGGAVRPVPRPRRHDRLLRRRRDRRLRTSTPSERRGRGGAVPVDACRSGPGRRLRSGRDCR